MSGVRDTPAQKTWPFMFTPNQEGQINCGPKGPKLIFESLLDSGASYPSLYMEDFRDLGINETFYAAQSLAEFQTANGRTQQRIYEINVELVTEKHGPIVDTVNFVNPKFPDTIGGLCPVTLIGDGDPERPALKNGLEANERLSGVMPFLCAYASHTPGNNFIVFGEDRRDVLGSYKMPALRRYVVGLSQAPARRERWANIGDPAVHYVHRRGQWLDQDSLDRGSNTITVNPGQSNEASQVYCPYQIYVDEMMGNRKGSNSWNFRSEEFWDECDPSHTGGQDPLGLFGE